MISELVIKHIIQVPILLFVQYVNHEIVFLKVIKHKINNDEKINYDCTFYIFHASASVLVLVNTSNSST